MEGCRAAPKMLLAAGVLYGRGGRDYFNRVVIFVKRFVKDGTLASLGCRRAYSCGVVVSICSESQARAQTMSATKRR